ncbi:MAG TPA: hypothetical protein VJ953_18640 [Saprospiraceae bacterium]|nr:hypothetical protein [Saprospiraceae bacterium]
MKNFILLSFLLHLMVLTPLRGQEVQAPGKEKISYQAVARDAYGQIMADRELEIKASFTSKDGASNIWFSEIHRVKTNASGIFQLEIGGGTENVLGQITDIPWGKKSVFLSLEMKEEGNQFILLSRSQMLAVPYAFQARETRKVEDEAQMELRNQSIYWTTTGNNDARTSRDSAFHFLGNRDAEDLYIKTSNEERAKFTKNGQLQIFAGNSINGPDTDSTSYPLIVSGSNQGIYIEIDESRDGDNNFLTFADTDPNTGILGRVEGQTWTELTNTQAYKVQVALFALSGANLIASAIAHTVEVTGELASILGAPAGVANAIAVGALFAEAASLLIESINWGTYLAETVGVYYSSGGADYAEYIFRAPGEKDLFAGHVVGIKNGQVSLRTQGADHLRVISSAPIVLGNMPQPEEEFKYEKVAFRGQVPVYVTGEVNIGDYILPSGNNDGLAIAICPEDMRVEDYKLVIGVAWEAAEYSPMNLVNVAIGINTNDLGYKLDELDQKVGNILAYLQGEGSLEGLDQVSTDHRRQQKMIARDPAKTDPFQKAFTDSEFDQILDDHEAFIKLSFVKVKESLVDQGYELNNYPEILAMLDDPIPFMKKVRRDPNFLSQWASVDRHLQAAMEERK